MRWWNRFFNNHASAEVDTGESQEVELALAIKGALKELPRRQHEVFVLRHWHGFSTAETAELLGIDQGTVKSQLKRAIDKIKTLVE